MLYLYIQIYFTFFYRFQLDRKHPLNKADSFFIQFEGAAITVFSFRILSETRLDPTFDRYKKDTMKRFLISLLLLPYALISQSIALPGKQLNLFTLGDSNGSFPYSWPEQL